MTKGSYFTRSNFLGTKFVVYDALPPAGAKMVKSNSTRTGGTAQVSAGNYPVAHISYELNALGARLDIFTPHYNR